MSLRFKKQVEPALNPPNPLTSAPPNPPPPPPLEPDRRPDHRNVLVSHGIHRGHYPIGGHTVADVRRTLAELITIDPTAVAVIHGRPVSEDTVLGEDVQALHFVKPSSIKGASSAADVITIQGNAARLSDSNGQQHSVEVGSLAEGIADAALRGLVAEPIPDNVKWIVQCGPLQVYLLELKPALRWIRWLAPDSPAHYGPEAIAKDYQLATPYVVVKVPFRRKQLIPRVELFYRSRPLSGPDGDGGALYWPNLLNVSPYAYDCTAWFCTQYLMTETIPHGATATLDEIIHHIWGGMFNGSSEAHEGDSTFSLCQKQGLDPRVTDVERWQKHSLADPDFPQHVDWLPTGETIRSIVERELKLNRVSPIPDTASAISSILLKKSKPR